MTQRGRSQCLQRFLGRGYGWPLYRAGQDTYCDLFGCFQTTLSTVDSPINLLDHVAQEPQECIFVSKFSPLRTSLVSEKKIGKNLLKKMQKKYDFKKNVFFEDDRSYSLASQCVIVN
jgi:hypothetical protein